MDEEKKQEAIVKFKIEHKHQGLYDWCIQESFSDEKKDESPNDYIPFLYTVDFLAKNLQYNFNISNNSIFTDNKVVSNEFISAKLATHGNDESLTISLFGSKNPIGGIDLRIKKIDTSDKKKKERCVVSAYGEQEIENSRTLREYTLPSNMTVTLSLTEKNFNQLADAISSKSINSMFLYLSKVDGFYSGWTPTIHANKIKLLISQDNLFSKKNEKSKYGKFIRTVNTGAEESNQYSLVDKKITPCEFSLSFHEFISNEDDEIIHSSLDNLEEDLESEDSKSNELTTQNIMLLIKTHLKSLTTITNLLILISILLVLSFVL